MPKRWRNEKDLYNVAADSNTIATCAGAGAPSACTLGGSVALPLCPVAVGAGVVGEADDGDQGELATGSLLDVWKLVQSLLSSQMFSQYSDETFILALKSSSRSFQKRQRHQKGGQGRGGGLQVNKVFVCVLGF